VSDDFDDYDDGDPEEECHVCGGDGYKECDRFDCMWPHSEDGFCPCNSCGGSGFAKDMTVW
jgi:hypothetical protein